MPRYDELKTVRKLSDRGDTNSVVHLVKEANADNLYVRKVIFGIEQPLYQGIFLREVQALYKLNNCDNIVKIISHRNIVYHTSNHVYDNIFQICFLNIDSLPRF